MDPKRTIEQGYDRLGKRYSERVAAGRSLVRAWFLNEVATRLSRGASVLELGCGPGTAAKTLAEGRRYLGVDLSEVQLAIARESLPGVVFRQGDFTRMDFSEASFDAVVAFYAFSHVPRDEQVPTFAKVLRWLRPGGRFMLSLMFGGSEGVENWLGVPMFFASFDRATNDRNLVEAGFELEMSEMRTDFVRGSGKETFQWVIARRPANSPTFSLRPVP